MEKVECHICEGTGGSFYSCCGDDISDNDIDLCPTCSEHCGEGDLEECEHCNGLGHVFESEDIAEIEREAAKVKEILEAHISSIDHYRKTGELYVGSSPPRQNWPGRAYYNTIDGRIWQLHRSSWTPMENQTDVTRLPKSYLVTPIKTYADAQALMKRTPTIYASDRDIKVKVRQDDPPAFRVVDPISIEQAIFMKEQEDKMLYGMPSSSTKVYHIDWKSIEKQAGIKFINADKNEEPSKNNNEPIHDHSIFDAR